MVHMLHAARALPKILTRYQMLMESPLETTQQLLEDLQERGANGLSMPHEKDIRDFVEPALKRAVPAAGLRLDAHQQALLAMLKGDMPFDPSVQVSPQSMQILQSLAPQM